jgi:Caulimovirus viroplasmin
MSTTQDSTLREEADPPTGAQDNQDEQGQDNQGIEDAFGDLERRESVDDLSQGDDTEGGGNSSGEESEDPSSTFGSEYCRVIFLKAGHHLSFCGTLSSDCRRQKHASYRSITSHRAPPGRYLPTSSRLGTDGHLDELPQGCIVPSYGKSLSGIVRQGAIATRASAAASGIRIPTVAETIYQLPPPAMSTRTTESSGNTSGVAVTGTEIPTRSNTATPLSVQTPPPTGGNRVHFSDPPVTTPVAVIDMTVPTSTTAADQAAARELAELRQMVLRLANTPPAAAPVETPTQQSLDNAREVAELRTLLAQMASQALPVASPPPIVDQTAKEMAELRSRIHQMNSQTLASTATPALVVPPASLYIAVVRGHVPGIYTNWQEVQAQVTGYPDSLFKSFRSQTEAETFLFENTAGSLTTAPGWANIVNPGPQQLPPTTPYHYTVVEDSSTLRGDLSKGREIHGVKLGVESRTLNLLCPKGVSIDIQKQLAATATDVLALPGKIDGASGINETVLQAMDDVMVFSKGGKEVPGATRDSQWKVASRNQLTLITTHAILKKQLNQLCDIRAEVTANFLDNCEAILTYWNWDHISIETWLSNGFLPRFLERTMDLYIRLLEKAESMTSVYTWERVLFFLDYHAVKLATIRAIATSRLHLITRSYVYLRDAEVEKFISSGYQGTLMEQVLTTLDKPKSSQSPSPAGDTKRKAHCTKCATTGHPGGFRKCPLKDMTNTLAKKWGKAAVELMELDTSLSFETAAEQAQAKKE